MLKFIEQLDYYKMGKKTLLTGYSYIIFEYAPFLSV